MTKIIEFLNQYPNAGTRISYGSAINSFLGWVYDFPTHKTRQKKEIMDKQRAELEKLADRYFIEDRNYAKDWREYNAFFAIDHTPTACQYYSSAIREFLIFNNVEFTLKEIRDVKKKVKRGRAVSEEHDLKKEDLKKILMYADLKLKCLILTQSSSGVRPGEVHTLDIDEIKLCGDYGRIYIPAHKSKNHIQRVAFCSKEAVEHITEWLTVRDQYISSVLRKTRGQFQMDKSKLKNRLFPFSDVNYRNMLKTALIKANLYDIDPVTKRAKIHPHLFRKFFETQMYKEINPKVIEKLVGHESELSRTYIKLTESDLLVEYQKGMKCVTILSDIDEETEKMKVELINTKDQMRDIKLENLETRQKLTEMKDAEKRVQELEKEMSGYRSTMTELIKLVQAGKIPVSGIEPGSTIKVKKPDVKEKPVKKPTSPTHIRGEENITIRE